MINQNEVKYTIDNMDAVLFSLYVYNNSLGSRDLHCEGGVTLKCPYPHNIKDPKRKVLLYLMYLFYDLRGLYLLGYFSSQVN